MCPSVFCGGFCRRRIGLRVLTESIHYAVDKVEKGACLDSWSSLRYLQFYGLGFYRRKLLVGVR